MFLADKLFFFYASLCPPFLVVVLSVYPDKGSVKVCVHRIFPRLHLWDRVEYVLLCPWFALSYHFIGK